MPFLLESYKRSIIQAMQLFPQLRAAYPVPAQSYLDALYTVLQDFNINTTHQRVQLQQKYRQYCEQLELTPEYFQLPFLQFSCCFVENLLRLVSLRDFHGEEYFQHFAQIIHGKGQLGLIALLQRQTPLSDEQWTDLQYLCLQLVPSLTVLDSQLLTTLYQLIATTDSLLFFCPVALHQYVEAKLNRPTLTRPLEQLYTRLGARNSISWTLEAFDLNYFYLCIEGPRDTPLLALFQLEGETVADIFHFQWLSRDKIRPRYYSWLAVPTYYAADYTHLFQTLEQENIIVHTRTALQEYGHWFSLPSWHPQQAFQIPSETEVKTQLTHIEDGVTPDTLPITFAEHHSVTWRARLQADPEVFFKVFTQKIPSLPVPYFTPPSVCLYSPADLAVLQQLIQYSIAIPYVHFSAIRSVWALEEYLLTCPRWCLPYLPHLLQYFPYGFYGVTREEILLQTTCPPQLMDLIQQETQDLDWQIRPISSVYYSPAERSTWFNFDHLRWKRPTILSST